MNRSQPILFSIQSYQYLCDEIAAVTGYEKGQVEVRTFPDGERYQRILSPVTDRDVILIGGTWSDYATLELYDLACALSKTGAGSLTLLIPYFAYSTQERAVKSGEIVAAKTRARLLSSIPIASNGNRVVMLDLHTEGIPHYFEGGIVAVHLYAKPVIVQACQDLAGMDFVLACTDAGRAKWVESLANDMGVSAAFVFKKRLDGQTTEITAMNAMVEGRKVIIYDDMIRTGGSLLSASQAYHAAGATEIFAITTHGIFPGGALEKLTASGEFKKILCTNSHPRFLELKHELFEVRSVAGLFANFLKESF